MGVMRKENHKIICLQRERNARLSLIKTYIFFFVEGSGRDKGIKGRAVASFFAPDEDLYVDIFSMGFKRRLMQRFRRVRHDVDDNLFPIDRIASVRQDGNIIIEKILDGKIDVLRNSLVRFQPGQLVEDHRKPH
ncbi:MAG TPA: hypothetical protein VN445_13745 [Rectinemataceae bacterium]|nr:hypothetical protein [Rectinemataceae bacterium]